MQRYTDKEEMAVAVNAAIKRANDDENMMNGMLGGELIDCDPQEKSIVLEYKTKRWQNNRAGVLHGGVMAAILDLTMGQLSICHSDELWTPTIGMEVKYIRPTQIGDSIIVKARLTANGKRINQAMCEAFSKNTGKLLSTATGVYFCTDTRKEHD